MDDGKEKSFQECMEVDRTLDLNAAITKKKNIKTIISLYTMETLN